MALIQRIKDLFHGYRTIRIAVMGSRRCGKTVLLTALANHLREHNPAQFPVGNLRISWDKSAIEGNSLNGLPLFDYNGARGYLAQGEWPQKTTDASVLALRLKLSDDSKHKDEYVQLEIMDIPGERISDFAMNGRSYAGWCHWMEDQLAGPNGFSPAYRDYLMKVRQLPASDHPEKAVLNLYRDFLAQEYAHFSPNVTPSTVRLEQNGVSHGGATMEAFRKSISNVPLGFKDKAGTLFEFAPLPSDALGTNKAWEQLVSKFSIAYGKYVESIVNPLVSWLKETQKLYYLVDMLSILQAGPQVWSSEKQYAEAALGGLCPRNKNGLLNNIAGWTKGILWKTPISSVTIVATKADLVLTAQNRDRLVALTKQLLDSVLAFLDVKINYFSCAAVCCTKEVSVDAKKGLQGCLNPKKDPVIWVPSDVPERRPSSTEEWNAMKRSGQFNYQFAFPGFDAAQACPPRQFGLNILVKEMLLGKG